MATYRRVYDSRHLQADCEEPGSAPEPYVRQSSMGYLYLFTTPNLDNFAGESVSERIRLTFGEVTDRSIVSCFLTHSVDARRLSPIVADLIRIARRDKTRQFCRVGDVNRA